MAASRDQVATSQSSPSSVRSYLIIVFNSSSDTLFNTQTGTTYNAITTCLPERSIIELAGHETEQNMSLHQCLKLYPIAIMWSVLVPLTLIMEGHSTILVPNLYSLGPFLRQFGTLRQYGDYEISAEWQSVLVDGAIARKIIGLFLAGWLAEKIGYRWILVRGYLTTYVPHKVRSIGLLLHLRKDHTDFDRCANACWVIDFSNTDVRCCSACVREFLVACSTERSQKCNEVASSVAQASRR